MRKKIMRYLCVVIGMMLLLSGCVQSTSKSDSKEITKMSQLKNASIGVWSGSICESACRKCLPDANYFYYDTTGDMATSVMQGKTDAFCITPPYFSIMKYELPELEALKETVGSFSVHFILRPDKRGEKIRTEINEYLARARKSGEIDEINARWYGEDESLKVIDRSGLTGKNGTIKLAVCGDTPIGYIRGNEVVGSEVEILTRFCTEYGYDLQIDVLTFSAIIPSMQTCKYDVAAASFEYSKERAKIVKFSDKTHDEKIILVVRKKSKSGNLSIFQSIKKSFNRTFLRYQRWKLFLGGISQTLLITVLSMIGGTALGFLIYLLCRNGGKAANTISRFAMWLIDGTPMVVLLMIFYYIIFSQTRINGTWVAIVCFSLTFACSMFGMLTSGVKAVGNGQLEGARALGYTDFQAFFKLILPQAAMHFLPTYQTAVVAHIKSTAIVGYIAVQDLTKVSDLIRSNTFDPFFPLLATAAIYFVLAWILTTMIGWAQRRIDSKNRDKKKILAGLQGGEML